MRVLAVETSSLTASVAVVDGGAVLGEMTTSHAKTHSQSLVLMIDSLFGILGITADSIDLFAASIGPGSFTGLRIGTVTVKGMAYALKKPVCGIPTLDALAYSVSGFKGVICPMMDARNNQVYTSLYRKNGTELERISEYAGMHVKELAGMLSGYDEGILILGDAAHMHYGFLAEICEDRLDIADPALFTPRAACTALLAGKKAESGLAVSPHELVPMYLRKSQAERMKGGQG